MTSPALENLLAAGHLKREPPGDLELAQHLRFARIRLADACNENLAVESRFGLAYDAAHGLALVALRRLGFRAGRRYLVFQCLPHTLGVGPEVWRVLALCHQRRNLAEYEGHVDIDHQLLDELIVAAKRLDAELAALGLT